MKAIKKIGKKIIGRAPHSVQKRAYLAWHYLHLPIKLPQRAIKTDTLELTGEEKKLKLVGFLKVHNEAASGNLERVLKHLKEICDEIVVCDSGSTDNGRKIIEQFTKHILSEPNDFSKEQLVKQKMLEYALTLKPDWIVWLDADEVFDRQGELGAVRKLAYKGSKEGIDGFSFQEINLWKSTKQYRTDEFWRKGWYVRLWRNNGKLKFGNQEGLHGQQYPDGLAVIQKSDIKVLHYGFSSSELIKQKYDRYKQNGQAGFALERVRNDEGAVLREVDRDWFPLSVLRVTVVAMVYQSTGYASFVYDSFLKHRGTEDFIFVANDATDRVKKYLKDKQIPHLIFTNPDPAEYYLNRVYRAWNYGGMNAPGDVIVFVNSDMAFSENWIKNLLKNLSSKRIITSRLVESGKMPSGEYGISKNFGQNYKEYRAEEFEAYAESIKKPELRPGGLFMPCLIYKDLFIKSGGYPIGNRKSPEGTETSGDHVFFYETLAAMGMKHFTAFDSLVYHVQEGEMDE